MSDLHLWIGFTALVVALVVIDLWVSGRRHRQMPVRTALGWSAVWIALSLLFGLVVWRLRGSQAAVEFYTGYLIEKSLSIDNLFLFLLTFARFRVPPAEQHRVLTWGILGAIVLRGVMILLGAELIAAYHPIVYGFGALLMWTGLRTLLPRRDQPAIGEGRLVGWMRRRLRLVPHFEGSRFFTVKDGRRAGTLLLLVLILIEASDVVFAVDSIPAIFAVTEDPFIVFSSNILAVLGLRALFFATADLLTKLRYLRHGLGVLLILIGAKMALSSLVHIRPEWSLLATVVVVATTTLLSLVPRRGEPGHAHRS